MSRLALAILILCLVACASQSAVIKRAASLVPGMSASDVRKLLGEPQNRQFEGKNEAWQYCSTDFSGLESDHYVLVWLNDGVVTGMRTYRNSQVGMCGSFFRTVNWQEAPDATIEVRRR